VTTCPGYLGIDVGTQGVRAVILAEDGRHLGAGRDALGEGRRDGVVHEQRAEDWWSAVCSAVRQAVQEAGPEVAVEGVALDATSGTVLVESADGTPRGPALMYDDARAQDQAVVAQRVGEPLWTALGYRLQPSWALPKLLWLRDHEMLDVGDRVVHQADHLVRRLTGAAVSTDTSHALKTGVDLRTARWPEDVFSALGIPVGLLPDVVLPGTPIGTIGVEGAQVTGLRAGTPVCAGMTDGCAAQIAAGALRPGSWSSALGTTLVIKGSTTNLVRDPNGSVYCHRNPEGGWLPGGASSTGAGALRHAFPDASSADLDRLTAEAMRLKPPAQVSYPLAGRGERFPFVAPDAEGFAAAGGEAELFAALCHGIAYVERLAYDVLGVLGADVSGPVALSGGGSRNAWWNQLRTDVLGRPSLVPESVEAAAGMAILAAAPPGRLTDTAERMVGVRTHYVPDVVQGAQLRPGYERLVDALVDRGWLDAEFAARALGRAQVGS
jgi:D-ribulokinase